MYRSISSHGNRVTCSSCCGQPPTCPSCRRSVSPPEPAAARLPAAAAAAGDALAPGSSRPRACLGVESAAPPASLLLPPDDGCCPACAAPPGPVLLLVAPSLSVPAKRRCIRLTVVLLTAALQRCKPDATLLSTGAAAAVLPAADEPWAELLEGLLAAAAEARARGAAPLSAAGGPNRDAETLLLS